MRSDRCLSLYVMQPLIGAGLHRPFPGIPILMYHSISEDRERNCGAYYKVCTPPALFREHLQILRESGFTVCDLDAAVAALQEPSSPCLPVGATRIPVVPVTRENGRSPVARDPYSPSNLETRSPVAISAASRPRLAVITFDDGFRDFLTDAWPALCDFGFSATVFLPTQFIGRQRTVFQGRDCLTWDEVRALRRGGAQFGSHTVTHPLLVELDDAAMARELSQSKCAIEEELGEPIHSFSHPFAFPLAQHRYVERFRRTLADCGYRAAVTTTLGRAQAGDDSLLLKRLPVNGADDAKLFCAKLAGAYDWLEAPQRVFKRLKQFTRGFRQGRQSALAGASH